MGILVVSMDCKVESADGSVVDFLVKCPTPCVRAKNRVLPAAIRYRILGVTILHNIIESEICPAH
jgi:hypothetical protein